MDYTVREVSLESPGVTEQVVEVLREAFGVSFIQQVSDNTRTAGSQPSLYLAAVRGDQLIGFNAFISHDLILDGKIINCYQSCWTATSAAHRGKKIFQNLILTAHDILRARGAGFVFGFPNEASYPLFTKKLAYREIPSLKWQMPNVPLLSRRWLSPKSLPIGELKRSAILQNDRELISLKRQEAPDDVLVAEEEGSLAWGIRRSRMFRGVPLTYLDIGGIELAAASNLSPLLHSLRRQAGLVAYIQIVSTQGNRYNSFFRRVRPSTSNCLIIQDLNLNTTSGISFNFFNGVRDVFK